MTHATTICLHITLGRKCTAPLVIKVIDPVLCQKSTFTSRLFVHLIILDWCKKLTPSPIESIPNLPVKCQTSCSFLFFLLCLITSCSPLQMLVQDKEEQ